MDVIRRTRAEALLSWVVTGPPGHLWSALADAALLCVRIARDGLLESRNQG